jgi:two-component system response regulator PilR (NtrC family)
VPQLTAAALAQLVRYPFPGNVRELENLLHRALALSGGEQIDALDLGLPDSLLDDLQFGDLGTGTQFAAASGFDELSSAGVGVAAAETHEALPSDLAKYLDDVERQILLRALERHRFNRTAAGAGLGLSLRQMRYRMARLAITADDLGSADV